uniref:JmjC domain-containing protein n=1 Tax=Attheya septentrionalis TaxID=420275 RepID=A0A7S2USI2_9STRA|mmetsp:Transcript_8101/g.14611  ORF Transcript_8101/g.14611 Transcript_8101/m.14611 type:complete len:506 (+) Transcript_8101:231-1748(+)|eukprot:CAMPEP_0198285186 /NCGR_PEP_ID=MMETSP1449-20131203/4499_1 /TAXON_ID=420275 /ORGANISM="Attheya septentrionalis, Strain CCMP2084" /LENGTH=505 /DNA_ID=CAMNT_0043982493 /DNA_START=207 /DNA_END=1724 /DNA_ORIENTATION=+
MQEGYSTRVGDAAAEEEEEENISYHSNNDDYPTLLALTGVRIRHEPILEEHISRALGMASHRVSVVEVLANDSTSGDDGDDDDDDDDDDEKCNGDTKVHFVVFPDETTNNYDGCENENERTAEEVAQQMNVWIMERTTTSNKETHAHERDGWLRAEEAQCTVVTEMEEEVWIESEEDALELWRDMSEDARTCHLAAVPSPDGVLVLPSHTNPTLDSTNNNSTIRNNAAGEQEFVSPTRAQLKRDPSLLEFDNVRRVHASELHTVSSWNEPIVIVDIMSSTTSEDQDVFFSRERLVERFGDVEVRTGNRNTLVENGFVNSKPMTLRDAILDTCTFTTDSSHTTGSDFECSRIVFSPVQELPDTFRETLESLMIHNSSLPPLLVPSHDDDDDDSTCFLPTLLVPKNDNKKYTLCLGSEGFGIGFHRHGAALFSLVVGRKKWYMGPPDLLDHDENGETKGDTHPAFYTTKSTHKCLQQPGEVLYVPDQWYHEIFNLEYTAGIQTLSSI